MKINNASSILVLPSWYPNKLSPYNGDFIKRHVEATGLFCKQHVIYVVKDEMALVTKNVLIEKNVIENCTENVIYYHPLNTGINLLDKFLSHLKYMRVYKKAIKKNIEVNGLPKICHVHIAMKAGFIALWIKRKYKVPYVLSEHWTGYLEESNFKLESFNYFFKRLLAAVINEATSISVVSNYLGKSIQKYFSKINYVVIPNVVDHNIFYPVKNSFNNAGTFIHISTMNYQKNIEKILLAFKILKDSNYDSFLMNLYGSNDNTLQNLINEYGLAKNVFLNGEIPQLELAKAIEDADALILYSRFETFGCVIIEANACGIPVIVSDLEVFHEIVENEINGIFVKQNDENALASVLKDFRNNSYHFKKSDIVQSTKKYSFTNIGKLFFDFYQKASAIHS